MEMLKTVYPFWEPGISFIDEGNPHGTSYPAIPSELHPSGYQ